MGRTSRGSVRPRADNVHRSNVAASRHPGTAFASVLFSMNRLTLIHSRIVAVLGVAALSFSLSQARAEPNLPTLGNICERHIAEAETTLDIPRQLLLAISVVESGVWDEARRHSTPRPWTVYAQKRGRRLANKAEALAEVRNLLDRGVRNIDVGCMQVNMHYHGRAFDSLEEALDPAHNVAYAALLLKSLYRDARSWSTAIARYHSWTPRLARIYHNKVKDAWNVARRTAYEDRRVASERAYKARRAAQAERKRLRLLARAG